MTPSTSRLLKFPIALCLLLATGCGVIADTHNRRGVRSAYQGDVQSALASFQRAAQRDPDNSDAFYNMAASMHRLGKQSKNQHYLQQAEELYNQSLDHDPRNTDSYRGLAVLLAETQRSAAAFRLLRGWATSDPTNPDAHVELARLSEEFKDKDAAIQSLQSAIAVDHDHPRALTALAALRESEGNQLQALKDYQLAYRSRPRPEIAAKIASLQRSIGASGVGAPGTTITQPGLPAGSRLATPGTRMPRY